MKATLRGNDLAVTGRRPLQRGRLCLVLVMVILAAVPGCRGCGKDPAEAEKERERKAAEERAKKKEEPKPDFEIGRLTAWPASELPPAATEPLGAAYKPGHWTAASLEAKTNNFDFVGDLRIAVGSSGGTPTPILAVPFDLTTSRQVTLKEKQQPKTFESLFLVPESSRSPVGHCRLNWRKDGRRAWEGPSLLSCMPSYQYHFVVLAALPESYAYLKSLDCVGPPTDEFSDYPTKPYYRVSLIRADEAHPKHRVPLPSYGLLWTSIACVLWDEAEPDALDLNQQVALLDWLHWGGQLIISGPGTLDRLAGSFLEAYLPATAAPGTRQLCANDFDALHQWSTASRQSGRSLVPPKNWTGVRLEKHARAEFLPGSGDLIVERRVGRGRIVVSAFGLSSRALRSWPGVDEMYNAFLLRRPGRTFSGDKLVSSMVTWADGHRQLDAGCISNLRYFGRDLRQQSAGKDVTVGFGPYLPPATADEPDFGFGPVSQSAAQGPGVAGWSDFNPVSDAARTALRNAAQIEIPGRGFVVWILAAYLLVLVPVNWAVFRTVNHVEWAWVAAPVIALGCTMVVVRMAQLDIGFYRSRTEISVVELQADYPRAHVTRYTALYTSLMTTYEAYSEDPGTLVLPFPEVDNPNGFRGQNIRTLLFRRGVDASLAGYHIQSNSTGMVHSEQMVDLGGALFLIDTPGGRLQLVNDTQFALQDVGVVRKDYSDNLWTASLDRPLEPGVSVPLTFDWMSESPDDEPLWPPEQGGSLLAAKGPEGESLLDAAQDVSQLGQGEVRLVAWLGEEIPGLEVRPTAPQGRFATLVVAHLRYGTDQAPAADTNCPSADLRRKPAANTEEEELLEDW